MAEIKTHTPAAFKLALLNLIAGTIGIVSTLLFSVTKGVGEISIGLILLGLGEYINNPHYNVPRPPGENREKPTSYFSRRRNVSSIGNLLDIAGLLMLSIGGATLFF
ncbi:hypothetical protein [Desulforhopalus sp. 52FAK]